MFPLPDCLIKELQTHMADSHNLTKGKLSCAALSLFAMKESHWIPSLSPANFILILDFLVVLQASCLHVLQHSS